MRNLISWLSYLICFHLNKWQNLGQLCAPPISFSKSVILSAKKSSGFITESDGDSVKEFLKSLEDQNLPHRVLYNDEREIIKAISFPDPKWFPEKATKNQLQFNVAVSDVTFGITTPKSGISKWSFITLLTPGHEAFFVVAVNLKSPAVNGSCVLHDRRRQRRQKHRIITRIQRKLSKAFKYISEWGFGSLGLKEPKQFKLER